MNHTNEKNTRKSNTAFFDPIVVLRDVVSRWMWILLAAVMVGSAAYVYTDVSYSPRYQSSITYVVCSQNSSATVYSNLSSANQVAAVLSELLNSSVLRKTILQESGIGEFNGTITSNVITETNLLTVTVQDENPRTAYLMAEAIVAHQESVTYLVVDGVTMEVLRSPSVAVAPVNIKNADGVMKKAMLIAAVLMAALLAYISANRDVVRSQQEVAAKLDCKYMGLIPHENKYKTFRSRLRRKKTSILITDPITGFGYVESIRKLCSKVENHLHEDRVIMVTSLLENEGKSTVAVNLALEMAHKHDRVLLIDCDLRKPACYAVLGQKDAANGLHQVLSGQAEIRDVLLRERKSGLHLLLEKKRVSNSCDLLTSQNMRDLLAWAKENYDRVILDLPPMAEAADAEGVAELADVSLLVVRQNAAYAPALNKAINALGGGKARLLGCVLNNVYTARLFSGESYGYGYGYGYGKYGHYGKYGKYGKYGRYGQNK